MWVSIQELNEMGDYAAVELHQAKDVNTGGVFQLRQVQWILSAWKNTNMLVNIYIIFFFSPC